MRLNGALRSEGGALRGSLRGDVVTAHIYVEKLQGIWSEVDI